MTDVHLNLSDIDEIASFDQFIAGPKFSIADVQIYNEVFNVTTHLEIDISKYQNLKRWFEEVSKDM